MRKKVDPATIQMWREYKRTEDVILRNQLLEKYLPLVRYIAERMLAEMHRQFSCRLSGLLRS